MPNNSWHIKSLIFLNSINQRYGSASVLGGEITLYGTCYASLSYDYLGVHTIPNREKIQFVKSCQDKNSGLFIGPELYSFRPDPMDIHDMYHITLHLTCSAALPFLQHYGIIPSHPIREAHRFCQSDYLKHWLESRNFKNAWFEGNNILFVGQLLIYLRDFENHPKAQNALDLWFEWLDHHIDPKTGLWGTNGFCRPEEAVYGGYHPLLVYYHEKRGIKNPEGLVDTVLSLQHADGSFNPKGNGGACEDVDCVDILVNMYKRFDYKREKIMYALKRCMRHVLLLQNPDGGFPYNRNRPQSHMKIPGTITEPNASTVFATWFRVHTLALIAQILPDEPIFQDMELRFSKHLSMGWHQPWDPEHARILSRKTKTVKGFFDNLKNELLFIAWIGRNNLSRLYRMFLTFYRRCQKPYIEEND